MSEEVTAERIAVIARAARVPLPEQSAARIARAAAPTIARFAAIGADIALETEPSTFVAVQRRELAR